MSIGVSSEVTVSHLNSEMADVANPRGEVYGEVFYVVHESSDGTRQRHTAHLMSEQTANSLADCIRRSLAGGGTLKAEFWYDIDPAYGSEAYQSLDNMGYFYARERKEAGERP